MECRAHGCNVAVAHQLDKVSLSYRVKDFRSVVGTNHLSDEKSSTTSTLQVCESNKKMSSPRKLTCPLKNDGWKMYFLLK